MTDTTAKRALITGASSGIGQATALAFARAGVSVVLVGRSQERLSEVAVAAQALGVEVVVYPMDLAVVDRVGEQIRAIATKFGPIDILVNNAGMGYRALLRDTPLADWQEVLDVNVTSVFQCIQALLPHMRDRQQGSIVNVASIAARQAFPEWGLYSVSKAALVALGKVLAEEERAHGIRVSTVCPGAVDTPLWDTKTVQADFNRAAMLTPDVVAETIVYMAMLPAQAVLEEVTLVPAGGAL